MNHYSKLDVEEICDRLKPCLHLFEGKNILLTGGGGFLGRYFSAIFTLLNTKYLSRKINVEVVDNFITSNNSAFEENKNNGINYIKKDIVQPFKSDLVFDFIIHAAGIASPYYYQNFPLETIDVSVNGTRNMLELAKQDNSRMIFFSSSEIYGEPDSINIPTKESYNGNVSTLGERACYHESKRMGETLCNVYKNHFKVNVSIIRPFNIYGPGMGDKDFRVLPNFASCLKSNLPLNIYGNGLQTRTFCYITDAMVGFIQALLKGTAGEAYNIGVEKPEINMIDLVNNIKTILPKKDIESNIISYPDSYPSDEPNRRCPDINKAKDHLGYNPMISLEEGLNRFFTWSLEN